LKLKVLISIGLLIFLLLGSPLDIYAQHPMIEKLSNLKAISIKRHPISNDSNTIYLPMHFNTADVIEKYDFNELPKGKDVIRIHLAYTRYKEVDTFNQKNLNRNRFIKLYEKFPELFDLKEIEWRVYEQVKATKHEVAEKELHGFVIFLREPRNWSELTKERSLIDRLLLDFYDSTVVVPDKKVYRVRRKRIPTGKFIPVRWDKQEKGIRYNSSSIWGREPEYKLIYDTLGSKTIKGSSRKIGIFNGNILKNSYEYESLVNRKFEGKWAIVSDVTASMSPYSAQVLAFLKTNVQFRKNSNLVFFNDGDGKPESLKRLGYSGGIYYVGGQEIDSVYFTMLTAMKNGDGGDYPENSIEAIVRAINKWPKTDSVLLIADSKAMVKDIKLLKYIKKPVCILLCGNVNGDIPEDYLEIAHRTKGCIIQTDGDLRITHKLKNGETIELNGREYRYSKNSLLLNDD